MKNILRYGSIALALFFAVSCESWLDVKPADRTSADELFSSREGFLKALNGVYVELNHRNIYGRNMSTLLDVMGQYYIRTTASSSVEYPYDAVGRYAYTIDKADTVFRWIWEKQYNLIVNLNVIIDLCGESNSHLPGIWHGLVKGEAKAMRAFLHLDILRLFGPIYSQSPTATAIPYVTNSDQIVSPLLTAEEVGKRIIDELVEAIALLRDADPIIEGGRMNSAGESGDNSLRFRQYRMNYYAARALLARAYMWVGDHENAYITSTELLRDAQPAGGEVFPFITSADALDATVPDRVFSTEAMFALYDNNITQRIFDYTFAPTRPDNEILKFYTTTAGIYSGRISGLYDNQDDYRYRMWFSTYSMGGRTIYYMRKFETPDGSLTVAQNNKLATFRYMHPLLRITEVYLIAAESCLAHKGDLMESKGYLNRIRAARGVADLAGNDATQLSTNIEAEFRREMLGEGQMFFYYKRSAKTPLPNGTNMGTVVMPPANYVVPLPYTETNERETAGDNE